VGEEVSTKATIDYGEDWHLFEEVLDETIHLELDDAKYFDFSRRDGGRVSLRVRLPEEMVAVIRDMWPKK
jgi:hypothetical protein